MIQICNSTARGLGPQTLTDYYLTADCQLKELLPWSVKKPEQLLLHSFLSVEPTTYSWKDTPRYNTVTFMMDSLNRTYGHISQLDLINRTVTGSGVKLWWTFVMHSNLEFVSPWHQELVWLIVTLCFHSALSNKYCRQRVVVENHYYFCCHGDKLHPHSYKEMQAEKYRKTLHQGLKWAGRNMLVQRGRLIINTILNLCHSWCSLKPKCCLHLL